MLTRSMQKRPGPGTLSSSLGRAACAGVANESRNAETNPARTTFLTHRIMRGTQARHGSPRYLLADGAARSSAPRHGEQDVTKRAARLAGRRIIRAPVPFDALTAFGVMSVTAMLLFYALEERSRVLILGFAVACWASAAYAWLAGAWPFTVVELVWGFVALQRYRSRR